MKRGTLAVSALAGVLSLSTGFALAAAQAPAQEQAQIYGSQLMTRQERAEYSARMRAAKTAEEREQIRREHHDRMQERAMARGVTLPDEPPAGRGMSSGAGTGPGGGGMGPGGRGMGPGGGRSR